MGNVAVYSVVSEVNELRMKGIADEHIAFKLRMSEQQVRNIPLPRPDAPKSRAVQHLQLRMMAQALMPRVEAGDARAIQVMIKVMQREADLLGLDAPKEVISHNFTEPESDLRKMSTSDLERLLAATTIEGEHTREEDD